jgi:hypothetical protein
MLSCSVECEERTNVESYSVLYKIGWWDHAVCVRKSPARQSLLWRWRSSWNFPEHIFFWFTGEANALLGCVQCTDESDMVCALARLVNCGVKNIFVHFNAIQGQLMLIRKKSHSEIEEWNGRTMLMPIKILLSFPQSQISGWIWYCHNFVVTDADSRTSFWGGQ